MPSYSYYPQGAAYAGAVTEAWFEDDDAALDHATQVAAAHAEAQEVSVWSGDRYLGRLLARAAQPEPAPTETPASGAKRRRRASGAKPK
jgi:hypothetical protein